MASYNKVIFIGNVTRDPEMKMTPKGNPIASFGIAVNEKRKDSSGAYVDDTMFLDCDAFGKVAEIIGQYVKKGNPLLVDGKLKIEKWEKDGVKHSRPKIFVGDIQLLGGGKREESAPQSRQAESSAPKAVRPTGNDPVLDAPADDIPF